MTPKRFIAALFVGAIVGTAASQAQDADSYRKVDGRSCCIADMPYTTAGSLGVGYAFPSKTDAPGWGDLSVAEGSLWGHFADWETDFGADLAVDAGVDEMTLITSESGANDGDPYPLTMARVHIVWTQRYEQNYGFEADASPGLYSGLQSFEGGDFSVPFGARWILPITPDFSVFAGANVYPTFDHVIDPRLGLRLAYRDSAVLDLAYPETRIVLTPHRQFRVTGGVRFWNWPEFNMGDDARERLRYDETRLYAALELGITEYTMISLQGGMLMQRKISFESEAADIKIDDSPYAGIGLTWLL